MSQEYIRKKLWAAPHEGQGGAADSQTGAPRPFSMPAGYWAYYGIQLKSDPTPGWPSLAMPSGYRAYYGMSAPTALASVQRRGAGERDEDPARIHEAAQRGLQGSAQTLPHLDQIQRSFGRHDVRGVRAHVGGPAAEASRAIGATAYAAGDAVAFREIPDLHTAAHEAAHVVQQRGGVRLKGGVGEVGDPYERHADAVAALVTEGRSAEALLDQHVGGGGASGVQPLRDRDTTIVEGSIIGHASPRWEHTRGAQPAELNRELSQQRAERVQLYLMEAFRQAYGENPVQFALQTRSVDVPEPDGPGIRAVAAHGVGDAVTLQEAGGDTRRDDASMRRCEIQVAVTHQITGEARSSEARASDVTVPGECAPDATNQWAISCGISGGAGHDGVGGTFAIGRLKNRRTGQVVTGAFLGGGLGVGLQSPGGGFSESFTDFTTDGMYTFRDFENTLSRFTSASAGIGFGYGLAWISFPFLGANSIYVGGFSGGNVGADASTNVGVWHFTESLPAPHCQPARRETRITGAIGATPYRYDIHNALSHVVNFETGSSEPSDVELARLQEFAMRVAEGYRPWAGSTR